MKRYEKLYSQLNTDNRYWIEERAAIIEFEGGIARERAEDIAVDLWNEKLKKKYDK